MSNGALQSFKSARIDIHRSYKSSVRVPFINCPHCIEHISRKTFSRRSLRIYSTLIIIEIHKRDLVQVEHQMTVNYPGDE